MYHSVLLYSKYLIHHGHQWYKRISCKLLHTHNGDELAWRLGFSTWRKTHNIHYYQSFNLSVTIHYEYFVQTGQSSVFVLHYSGLVPLVFMLEHNIELRTILIYTQIGSYFSIRGIILHMLYLFVCTLKLSIVLMVEVPSKPPTT